MSLENAAERLGWPVDKLNALENAKEADEKELERIASRYKLPLPTLLMPEPLPDDRYPLRPISDFRVFDGAAPEPLSVDTLLRVEDAYELVEMFGELADADPEATARPALPAYRLRDDPKIAAAEERARIGANLQEQLGWVSDKDAFLRWRQTVEDQGIVVQRFPLHEQSVRGFALFEDGFGIIVIDSTETDYRPRSFTLMHEYGHLLLRASGISDQNRKQPVERWCNQFAANFLMPEDAFVAEYRLLFTNATGPTEYQVSRLSTRFRTSKSSVAIRFEEVGLAPLGFYDALKAEWQKRERKRGGGGNNEHDQIDVELGRYGTTHIGTIGNALRSGVIDPVEAQYALDVPNNHIPALMVAAQQRRRAYGGTRR